MEENFERRNDGGKSGGKIVAENKEGQRRTGMILMTIPR